MVIMRNFEAWPGNHKFKFEGRLMLGENLNSPDYKRAIITIAMIFIPLILLISFSNNYFIHDYPWELTLLILLSLLSLSLLSITSCSNPGFLPKQEHPFDKLPEGIPTMMQALIKERTKKCSINSGHFVLPFKGKLMKIKYCDSCYIVRPPRCSHCGDCDVCIEKFDHHCPWLGNCIGKYNYKYFMGFLYSTSTLTVLSLAFGIDILVEEFPEEGDFLEKFTKAIENQTLVLLFLLYGVIVMWFVVGMAVFHTFLWVCNVTTHEFIKKIHSVPKYNPFYVSVSKSVWDIFKKKTKEMIIDFRGVNYDSSVVEISMRKPKVSPDSTEIHEKLRFEKMDFYEEKEFRKGDFVKFSTKDSIKINK